LTLIGSPQSIGNMPAKWLCAILLLAAGVAHAQDQRKAARQKYERAITEYNLQNWQAALRDFQEVYRDVSDPAILFNIGQCQRQLGEYEAAAKSYRLYLAQASNVPNGEQVRRLIAQMDEAAKEKRAQAPPIGPQAAPAPATTAPPSPPPSGTAPVEVSHRRERPWYKDPTGLALAGGGVAAVVVGGALLGVAAGEGSSAEQASTQADFDLHHGNDLTYQKAGWPILGVGLASITVGSIVLALHGRHPR